MLWGSTKTDFIVWGAFMAFVSMMGVAGVVKADTWWKRLFIAVIWLLWVAISVRRFYTTWQDAEARKVLFKK